MRELRRVVALLKKYKELNKVVTTGFAAKLSLSTKMSSPSERNKEPILNVLQTLIPEQTTGEALEIASGCGTHALHFANYFKNITWQPTDVDLQWFKFIEKSRPKNVKPGLILDVSKQLSEWPPELTNRRYDLIVCINMIHITPFTCTEGLFTAAGQLLKDTGLLVTYGPYAVNGVLTPQSNVNFDKSLRRSNELWGVRDVAELQKLASRNGLTLYETFEMPANNKTLVFRKCHN